MAFHRFRYRWGGRRGVTLIELLVVMLIVLTVSAMTMTAAAPALESRRVREAARLLEVMINKSRNRALQTGRPAGIWLDRMQGLAEAAISVSMAEVPEPYGGDYPNSGVSVVVEYFGTTTSPPGPSEGVAVILPHLVAPNCTNPSSWQSYADIDYWGNPDNTVQQVVRPGDMIQFNFTGPRFLMQTTAVLANGSQIVQRYGRHMFYFARALPRVDSNGKAQLDSNGYIILDWFHNGASEVNGYLNYYNANNLNGGGSGTVRPNFIRQPVPYRIFRQPIKSAGGSVNLPDGAVIDLNYSGTRRLNFHPRLNPAYADATTDQRNTYGTPPNPFTGVSWIWSTAPTQCSDPQWSDDTSPVILMFTPSGLIDRIYARTWEPFFTRPQHSNRQGSWEWNTVRVYEPIHFLVGKRDKLPAPTLLQDEFRANWTDTQNLWVTVNPSSGYIGTSENAEVPYDMVINGLRGHSTSWSSTEPPNNATYTYYDSTSRNNGWLNGLDNMAYGARRIANMQQAMGGR